MPIHENLKELEPQMWADGRRAYEQGEPQHKVLMGASADKVAAFRGGWAEAREQLKGALEDPPAAAAS